VSLVKSSVPPQCHRYQPESYIAITSLGTTIPLGCGNLELTILKHLNFRHYSVRHAHHQPPNESSGMVNQSLEAREMTQLLPSESTVLTIMSREVFSSGLNMHAKSELQVVMVSKDQSIVLSKWSVVDFLVCCDFRGRSE